MGRPKGSPNKKSHEARELAEELGINPLEVLLYFTSGDWASLGYEDRTKTMHATDGTPYEVDVITPEMRLRAASEVCQYLYPKRKSVEIENDSEQSDQPITVKVQWADEDIRPSDAPEDTSAKEDLPK